MSIQINLFFYTLCDVSDKVAHSALVINFDGIRKVCLFLTRMSEKIRNSLGSYSWCRPIPRHHPAIL